jgi:UDP-2-acetamido-2-deoxy-ribo-hexuluronate aminotransferase
MHQLILDAEIAAEACMLNGQDEGISILLEKADREGWRLWLYTGQLTEILHKLYDSLSNRSSSITTDSASIESEARRLLNRFVSKHHWLSALSEDAGGLDEVDSIAFGLTRAARRMGKEVAIVTRNVDRLKNGFPFIDVDVAREQNPLIYRDLIGLSSGQDRIRLNIEHNIQKVLGHCGFIMGPEVTELESQLSDYVGVEHCVCLSSGTDALLVALMALGLSDGDEVITTPFTFAATGEAIMLLGAKVVYVDIDRKSYNINVDIIEEAITDKTKVIMPVSLYGQCPDFEKINKIADMHGLSVVEDAAQSFGASFKGHRSCGLSTIGCTSFFPTKPLGGYGDGGACFTSDKKLADLMRLLINHGQEHKYNHTRLGINGRMDTLQAAVLLAKLEIFEDEITRRNVVAQNYSDMLAKAEYRGYLQLPKIMEHCNSVWAQYTIQVSDRDNVQKKLSEAGIPTSVHYPTPLYRQPALYQQGVTCTNTEKVVTEVLSLPMHPYLSIETQAWISETLIQALE